MTFSINQLYQSAMACVINFLRIELSSLKSYLQFFKDGVWYLP
ncbi:hypothetical protein PALI_a1856 [Pseudoalteromonas aliena SW19]|uniref:Transposase n=1 Tax=Pseudoalteromonas aliena SW19 TaxID=1314866 RepID=A0ABR9DW23_9GAMM|nr:hypothetical protein [Pseudoalteromonas aliena SW19]